MIQVGDIVKHTVYGCGMVVEGLLVVKDPMGDRELATLWLFDNKEWDEGRREQAVVSVRFLKPFVAHVET